MKRQSTKKTAKADKYINRCYFVMYARYVIFNIVI